MTRSLGSGVLLLLLAAGCRSTPPAVGRAGFRVDTVATTATLPLETPIAALPLPAGRVALLDYKASRLYLLDSTGKALETFGGHGKGPGEFLFPYGLTLHADTLAVFDIGNGRLVNFLPQQGFVGVRSLPAGFAHQAFLLLDGDTTLHSTDGVDSALAVLRSPTGQVLARYGTPLVPPTTLFDFGSMKQAAAEGRVPDEFKNTVLPILGPKRDVWLIQQATGRIDHFSPEGRLLGGLTLPQDYVAKRVEAFLEASRAVAKDPGRIGGIAMAGGGAAEDGRLWVLLVASDSVPPQLALIDTSYSIRATYSLAGATGATTLTRDPASGCFYLLNIGEGILLRVTLLKASAA